MRKGFTLIEILVTIAAVGILALVVFIFLNPVELLRQSRDSNRIADLSTVTSAFEIFSLQGGTGMGSTSVVYVSIPDPTATSSAGTQCQGLNLIPLPATYITNEATYTYHCASPSNYLNIDGTGWIPVNLTQSNTKQSLSKLPVDPLNVSSSNSFYTYTTDGVHFELTAALESSNYKLGGSHDVISGDGGSLATVYEKGSRLGIAPLDYGDSNLIGFWPFEEGGSSVKTYDFSGHNVSGSWSGLSGSELGTHYTKISKIAGNYAGYFDGNTDSIALGGNPLNQAAYTKTAWIYVTNFNAPNNILSSNSGNVWWLPSPNGRLASGHNGAYTSVLDPVAIPASTWVFAAVTYDGSNLNLYKNGVLVSSASGIAPSNDTNLTIGAFQASNFFQGYLDNIRLYNRALSPVEIQALYAGKK
jgi:prepilin-type N-terminal cleavage/methylation domain-containing protein